MKKFLSFSFYFFLISILGCSSSKRFTKDENYTSKNEAISEISKTEVRLLIEANLSNKEIIIDSPCFLFKEEEQIKTIYSGEVLNFSASENGVLLKYDNNISEADYFQFIPTEPNQLISFNNFRFRSKIKILNNSGSISIINSVDLESYLKGVIPREMPLGRGTENYEALKAFAICARTYSLQQLNSKKYFDLYTDVRDQVYGGVDVENPISNSAVDETKNLILTYDGKPAKVFYFSTCGGKTEDVKNIFGTETASYLSVIEDGHEPYCSISPSFNWEEIYPQDVIISRLLDAGLLNYDFDVLENFSIVRRFESGRVNELQIDVSNSRTFEKTSLTLKGNPIRSIIRTSNNQGILRSIWFDVSMDENKNVTITGKGNGHGVGLCQWGAIGQSRSGKIFKEILNHYFPGTKITKLDDKH